MSSAVRESKRRASRQRKPVRDQRASAGETWIPWILGTGLVIVTVVVYLPALNGGFIWDDEDYVRANVALTNLTGLGRIWFELGAVPQYYPLTFTTFWVEHQLWGDWVTGYHLVNLCLHLGSAFLIWRLFAAWWGIYPAWVVAALFALHPVHIESVAWITERKNVLSAIFYLGSAMLFLRGMGLLSGRDAASTTPRYWYAASLGLFCCALLSKTVTASLPAALLLIVWWRRGHLEGADLVRLAPFLALGLAAGSVTASMETGHVGASGHEWDLTWPQRTLIAGRALWFYAEKLAWPQPLVFIYPRWNVAGLGPPDFLFPLAALAIVAALFALRNRIGRGPLVAVLFFGGSLFPALGFFDVYPMRFSFVADHFCYLASLGLIALVVGVAASYPLPSALRVGLVGLVLVTYAVLIWNRAHAYASSEVLWRTTVAQNPSAWIARNNYGTELLARGELEAAAEQFHQALRLNPQLDDAHNNLGVIARTQGNLDQAIAHFSETVRISPTFGAALLNLASVLHQRGRVVEAIDLYRRALQTQHRDNLVQQSLPLVHANLGLALEATGDPVAALSHYREALRLDPNLTSARTRIAALEAQSRVDGAARAQ